MLQKIKKEKRKNVRRRKRKRIEGQTRERQRRDNVQVCTPVWMDTWLNEGIEMNDWASERAPKGGKGVLDFFFFSFRFFFFGVLLPSALPFFVKAWRTEETELLYKYYLFIY